MSRFLHNSHRNLGTNRPTVSDSPVTAAARQRHDESDAAVPAALGPGHHHSDLRCPAPTQHDTWGGEEREDAQIAAWKDAWEFEFLSLIVSSLLPQE